MFREQVRVSQELFESLREQMILQVSHAIKPLVTFLQHHDCDEDEILAAIFEAIAYEKNAELELGVLAFDKQRDWAEQMDTAVADRFSQLVHRIGLELFRDFQSHRLYQHGFLPYQFRRRHGTDVLVDRLGVPEILHREQQNWEDGLVWKMRGKDGSALYFPAERVKPRGELLNMDFYHQIYSIPLTKAPAFQEHRPIVNRVAGLYEIGEKAPIPVTVATEREQPYLCGLARAFKNFYERQAEAEKTTVVTPDSEVSVKPPVDEAAIDAWEREMKALFAGIGKSPAVIPPDERNEMTQDELNEWFAKLLWEKQLELKHGSVWMKPEKRRLMELVYRAKVLGDAAAGHELEEHISKTIRVVEEKDAPSA